MPDRRTLLVIGGTAGIGLEIARRGAARGDRVVLAGRDSARAQAVAASLAGQDGTGGDVTGLGVDLGRPDGIAQALAGLTAAGADAGVVDHLVLSAIERDQNTAADYNLARAAYLTTLKLVGYIEVIHALLPSMTRNSSIVLFGGLAKDRPYPGSTTVSTINGGVTGMVHTLAVELAPVRVNAVHPGIVGDSPFWHAKPAGVLDGYRCRTPTGRLASMADVADAVEFLLRNRSVNGVNLNVDGGWMIT